MATYRVYQDFGDFGVESTVDAPYIAAAIRKVAVSRNHGCEYTFRLHGVLLAAMKVDQFGNPTIEVLERVEHDMYVAYATNVWKQYFLNGCYELCPVYHQPHED